MEEGQQGQFRSSKSTSSGQSGEQLESYDMRYLSAKVPQQTEFVECFLQIERMVISFMKAAAGSMQEEGQQPESHDVR